MSTPTWGSTSALNTAAGTSPRTPAVPAGVADGSLVFTAITVNLAGASASPPTDFTQVAAIGTASPTLRVHWKRATGADSGTYSVPHGGGAGNTADAYAFRVEGEQVSGNPIGTAATAQITSASLAPSLSLGAHDADSLLIMVVSLQNSHVFTPPAGWTSVTGAASTRLHICYKTSDGSAVTAQGSINDLGVAHNSSAIMFPVKGIVVAPPAAVEFRYKDSSGAVVTPTAFRLKDSTGAVVTPSSLKLKNTDGSVS